MSKTCSNQHTQLQLPCDLLKLFCFSLTSFRQLLVCMLITAIMSHKPWNFTLCQSLQVCGILESNFYSNQKVRSQTPTSQLKILVPSPHFALKEIERLKKNHRDANPNLPTCKISTKQIYKCCCFTL